MTELQKYHKSIDPSLTYGIILYWKLFFLLKISQLELKGKMLFHLIYAEFPPFLLFYQRGSSAVYKEKENYIDHPVLSIINCIHKQSSLKYFGLGSPFPMLKNLYCTLEKSWWIFFTTFSLEHHTSTNYFNESLPFFFSMKTHFTEKFLTTWLSE